MIQDTNDVIDALEGRSAFDWYLIKHGFDFADAVFVGPTFTYDLMFKFLRLGPETQYLRNLHCSQRRLKPLIYKHVIFSGNELSVSSGLKTLIYRHRKYPL